MLGRAGLLSPSFLLETEDRHTALPKISTYRRNLSFEQSRIALYDFADDWCFGGFVVAQLDHFPANSFADTEANLLVDRALAWIAVLIWIVLDEGLVVRSP